MIFFVILGYLIYRHYRRSQAELQAPEQTQVSIAYDDCIAYAEMLKRKQAEEKQRRLERKQQLKRSTAKQQIDNIDLLQDELYQYMDALYREEKALLNELPHASEKRAAQIQGKLTSIASKRASLSSRIANNENRIAKLQVDALG